jgi:hypothetical protein
VSLAGRGVCRNRDVVDELEGSGADVLHRDENVTRGDELEVGGYLGAVQTYRDEVGRRELRVELVDEIHRPLTVERDRRRHPDRRARSGLGRVHRPGCRRV